MIRWDKCHDFNNFQHYLKNVIWGHWINASLVRKAMKNFSHKQKCKVKESYNYSLSVTELKPCSNIVYGKE